VSNSSESAIPGARTPGYFAAGDRIQLTDPKGKLYSFTITPGKEWHTHKGWIVHDELIGLPEGSVVSTTAGLKFTAFIPLLSDYVLSTEIARSNVSNYFGELPQQWSLTIGSVQDVSGEKMYDRVILDMLAPWECVEMAARVLRPGGVFLAYVATTTQLSATAEALKNDSHFTEPESSETIVRGWHHEGLAVRPQQRMIGHTGFLIQSRRMAPGVEVLARRRRPAKGAYGVAEE